MKALIYLLVLPLVCSSCAALPAEERAFAVALCVEKTEVWRVYGRIPTYKSGGGYSTVSGSGESLSAALAAMDAEAPMRINLSQLRLLVAEAQLAQTGELNALLAELADRPDMRMECAVALTEASVAAVAEALDPAAGTRLSKALDLLLDARIEQGVILPAALSDVIRMGERQSPILIALALEGTKINLSGGYTMDGMLLDSRDVGLLSLLLGHTGAVRVSLDGGYADVRDASVKVRLQDFASAGVALTLNATASTYTEEGLERAIAEELLTLLSHLSNAGCDALGLGRHAIVQTRDMAQWHELDWRGKYRNIRWEVAVGVNGPA